MILHFFLRFKTLFGQELLMTGNHPALGNYEEASLVPLTFFNEEFWTASVEIGADFENVLTYQYILKQPDGELVSEEPNGRNVEVLKITAEEVYLVDTWNFSGEYENAFYTRPFREVLLASSRKEGKEIPFRGNTHVFRIKAPLLKPSEVLCLSGSSTLLGIWNTGKAIFLDKEGDFWTTKLNLRNESFPVSYKYGVFDIKTKKFVRFEDGENRLLPENSGSKKVTILHDGFVRLPNDTWKGAGVSLPVFSLRTKKSYGVGEFTDLKLLVDWAKKTSLKLIQILPVNDTTSTHTWTDSYPYSAISTFALHPIYLNLELVAGQEHADLIKPFKRTQGLLNKLPDVAYEDVLKTKWRAIQILFEAKYKSWHDNPDYFKFFNINRHWLVPYAAFCYLRDKYRTADYSKWKAHKWCDDRDLQKLVDPGTKHYGNIAIHYFVQYHLHLQLKEAADYAHKNGIIIKGDIPIGVNRYGVDSWLDPQLFNLNMQAGAPPDDFAVKGQNWSFPTYNWQKMAEDGFAWWRKRFEHMSNYFDAFRIDHILGFFRIWSIPNDSLEGIMGHFVPAIPVDVGEFVKNGIWFNYHRYTQPYVNDAVLWEMFGEKHHLYLAFLDKHPDGSYSVNEDFNTQRKVEKYFAELEKTEDNNRIMHGLFDILSNVLLIEVPGSAGQQFHFRIAMDQTISFRHLGSDTRYKLKELYIDYFYRRQDAFWFKEAMHKLPHFKSETDMLICGEDLGMVPHCVPDVMKQLGILSLEIQRMPKDVSREFFHPNDAPYLSVVTPSTHDMSTVRGWWEEDRLKTQRFFNYVMGHFGDAPFYCEAWINKAIILQHLYSPAMWSIFQVQDLLGMDERLRRSNPHEERINIPANPKHYWKYRMHITLEQLIREKTFNEELKNNVIQSGRA